MKRSERGKGPVGERELFPKGAEFDKSSGKSSKREEREKPVNRGLGDSKVSQPPGANVISLFKGGMGGVGWQQMLWFFFIHVHSGFLLVPPSQDPCRTAARF